MNTSGVSIQYLCSLVISLNHLSYGFMVLGGYHRSIMKDGAVPDGWWGLYPLGRHARVTKHEIQTSTQDKSCEIKCLVSWSWKEYRASDIFHELSHCQNNYMLTHLSNECKNSQGLIKPNVLS